MSRFSEDCGYQAFRILQATFIIAPIAAGLDKFFCFLTNWFQYLSPCVLSMVQPHEQGFMMTVGLIEIVAGIGVFFKPRIFSYIIAFWLFGIIINLICTQEYLDIALRDFGLLLAALSLGSLSRVYSS